jgi:capsular polysaccharide biosynthesis protein/Mrp family chromosome partitioning ATPase
MEIELRQVVPAAVRWGWLILLVALISGALAYAMTSRQTATYSATTTLLVNPQQVTGTADSGSLQASRSQAETYVRLVASRPVLDRVITDLSLPHPPAQLANKIEARVVMNTQLIEISVSDASPQEAARIANSVAAQFEAQVEDLTTGRLQENLSRLQQESASLQTRQAEIDAELPNLDTEANADDSAIQARIRDLGNERTRTQETLADLDSSIRAINQQLATTTSPVEVADEAQAAREPDSPKPMLMTALGLFLGLLVGAGLAAALEIMDKKIRPETDVEELTESRLLVTIPDVPSSAVGQPLVASHPDGASAEAIRMLRTRLGVIANSRSHSAIVFASAGGTDSTSEIVAKLGVVMAQAGMRMVIVDANLREPRQHRIFGIANDGGLASALSSGSDPVPGIDAATVAPRLSVLTAGSADGHAAEMVASAAFTSLIGAVRQEANVVLIDAPSAVESSDALTMASTADGVVLVARYGSTRRDDLARLAETIHQDGLCLIGVVMIRK